MDCHLHIHILTDAIDRTAFPALRRLLAAGRTSLVHEPCELALCRDFGLAGDAATLGALSWFGEGGDAAAYGWMLAEPVHLALQRDYFAMSQPAPLVLAEQEAATLLHSLNQHFAGEGMQFMRSPAGRFYLRLNQPASIRTSLLCEAAGRDVRDFQPQGEQALQWKKLLNEMQMLLHEHPLNQAREARGELSVNSLWLTGGRALPGAFAAGFDAVYSNLPMARGLARLTSVPCEALPENLLNLTRRQHARGLLVLQGAEASDERWFAPLLVALRSGRLRRLSLRIADRGSHLRSEVRSLDLWKFWRQGHAW